MNELIDASRRHKILGAKLKKEAQETCFWAFVRDLKGKKASSAIHIRYDFYEPNKKRDLDNISGFAHKVIQDALVEVGYIENDGWKQISGFSDNFHEDSVFPRIEVRIYEVGDLQAR